MSGALAATRTYSHFACTSLKIHLKKKKKGRKSVFNSLKNATLSKIITIIIIFSTTQGISGSLIHTTLTCPAMGISEMKNLPCSVSQRFLTTKSLPGQMLPCPKQLLPSGLCIQYFQIFQAFKRSEKMFSFYIKFPNF